MSLIIAKTLVKSLLQEGGKGCLMFPLPTRDAAKFIEWSQEHIPDETLTEKGREHEIHCTVLYGFSPVFRPNDIAKLVQSYSLQHQCKTLAIRLGNVSRFTSDPEHDVLKVEVNLEESPDLADLHYFLRGLLEPKNLVEIDYPEYHAHVTLAYVKKGACPELDGHGEFNGSVFISDLLIYSTPESEQKCGITLDGGLVEESLIALHAA